MKSFTVTLEPRLLGAEVLTFIARERLPGELSYGPQAKLKQLIFQHGRPILSIDANNQQSHDATEISKEIRNFATLMSYQASFNHKESLKLTTKLKIDTLGEIFKALLQELTLTQLKIFWDVRAKYLIQRERDFPKLQQIMLSTTGIELQIPDQPLELSTLLAVKPTIKAPELYERVLASMLILGGLGYVNAPDSVFTKLTSSPNLENPVNTPETLTPSVLNPETVLTPNPLTTPNLENPTNTVLSPEANLITAIATAHAAAANQDYYALLGVAHDADAHLLKQAYFAKAKAWHSDQLAPLNLPEETLKQAEELFRLAEEAQRILTNEQERAHYDWLLEQKAKGLPTDPQVVIAAETLFRKGQTLLRNGQLKASEPLLKEAAKLNPGEAEFWAYLGYALYSNHGPSQLAAAEQALNKALELSNHKLDVAYEFLGKIARAEKNLLEARKLLRKALSLKEDNNDAKRELKTVIELLKQQEPPNKRFNFWGLFK